MTNYPIRPWRLAIPLVLACALPACAASGVDLFRTAGCIDCHSFKGQGGGLGPDLTAVTARRSASWIARYIKNPRKIDPQARMPAFENLSYWQRQALTSYLDS